ncbi:MAG: leucine-rich repeat domain-containing protein [Verrucomicrobia bacterium]|nr:leucine-rich repeat domain-containing protein [Verrucomicrobiota bacterium]
MNTSSPKGKKLAITVVVAGLTIIMAFLPRQSAALTITDTFTNSANWGTPFAESGKNMAVANGRMNFTSATAGGGGAGLTRNTPFLTTTQSWSVKVDVHINPFLITNEAHGVSVFLGVGKTSDYLGTHILLGFDRDWWDPAFYGVNDDVQVNGVSVPGFTNMNYLPSADATLRLDYNSANQMISYYCDVDGPAGGSGWTLLGTTNIASGTYNLQLTASDTLSVLLAGWSEGHVVTNGQAYLDNLEIAMEPAFAPNAIAGYSIIATVTNVNGTGIPPVQVTNVYGATTFSQTGPNSDNTYSGTYTYTRTGLDTGTVIINKTAPPDQVGEMTTNLLVFTSPLTGTFAHHYDFVDTPPTVQYGTFQVVQTNSIPATDYTCITNNGAITITGYTGSGGAITIPSTINGLPVTSIGTNAFQNNGTLANVFIPSSVTNIGNRAFLACTSLTNIAIPNSVTGIGSSAFSGCVSLTSVTIPSSVISIGDNPFIQCYALLTIVVDSQNMNYSSLDGILFDKNQTTLVQFPGAKAGSYTVPSSVTNIGSFAFSYSYNLTSVTIGTNATKIGDYAFYACIGLTSITIPNGVTNIGNQAFFICSGLTNITIPDSVISVGISTFAGCSGLVNAIIGKGLANIGRAVFDSCDNLLTITVDIQNTHYSSLDGVLFNKSQTSLVVFPGGKAGSYTIPNTVTNIGDYAFIRCFRLNNLAISNDVISIGKYAFYGCYGLTSITIPQSVSSMSDYVLYSCSGLTNVTIPTSVTSIGRAALAGCTNLINITIPYNVTNIGDVAFAGCSNLRGIYFNGNTPSLGGTNVFSADNGVIVYYLPGTTDWNLWASPPPAVLWNPTMPTTSPSFGIKTNRFGFTITGTTNIPIVVEANTNVIGGTWTPLLNGTLTNGSIYFSDPQWTNYLRRFYRIRSP